MQSIWLIFQLLFFLFLGLVLAGRIPKAIESLCFKVLPYFTYLLLVAIAIEFSQTLDTINDPSQILFQAILISLMTSVFAFLCGYIIFKAMGVKPMNGKLSPALFIHSLINISYAFIALLIGYLIAFAIQHFQLDFTVSSWQLLLAFMFIIGLDMAYSPLDRSWLNWKILLVPISCILGSILGALFCQFWIKDIKVLDLIMLSQGYGFYSMSGIVITELRNAELGSIALINDLFREIFAIILMYVIGWRYPRSAISSAGATAMDVTLPMVKQACGSQFIPHAMVSGFILSIIAPIAVSILAAL